MTTRDIHDTATIDWYPQIYDPAGLGQGVPRSFLRIGLMHVRAAADIEIEYNAERDGWVVYMTVTVGTKDCGTYIDSIEERREKAFIPAWDEDEIEVGK